MSDLFNNDKDNRIYADPPIEDRDLLAVNLYMDKIRAVVKELPDNQGVMAAKAFYMLEFSLRLEEIVDSDENPLPLILEELRLLEYKFGRVKALYSDDNYLRFMKRGGFKPEKMHIASPEFQNLVDTVTYIHRAPVVSKASAKLENVNEISGELYSNLWPLRSDEEFFEWGTPFLKERLELNGIDLDWFKGKKCLDAGCGGGRTTLAISNLGVEHVTGLDIGEGNIRDATERITRAGLTNISFTHNSIFDMPFEDNTFDFVMCQGVLHHTPDTVAGLKEIYRVLKPGGHLWVYLYGHMLYYDLIEMIRDVVAEVPLALVANYIFNMGWAFERYLYWQTTFFVPIRTYLKSGELENIFQNIGYSKCERHLRDIQREHWITYCEAVYRKYPYAEVKYGEGDLRYWVTK